MTTSSTQQRLSKIFPESFQVKRLIKQINDLKQLREKDSYDIKMSLLKNQCLIFRVQVKIGAYKGSKLPDYIKILQEFKILVRRNYPAHPPNLYYTNDNMIKLGLKPFRDYMPLLMNILGEWSAKYTLMQLIKTSPSFYQYLLTPPIKTHSLCLYPTLPQYFQIQSMYSWKFCQVHPIRLIKRNSNKQGFMYVNINTPEIVFLEQSGVDGMYLTCDYVKGSDIYTLRKKKNMGNQYLLQVKLDFTAIKGRFGIQFTTQDPQAIVIAVAQCSRLNQSQRKLQSDTSQQQQPQQSDNQSQQEIDQSPTQKKIPNVQLPTSIQQILDQILIYQSLVDNKMTGQNLSQLVALLQKAIQYYSAIGDNRFSLFLNKLQSIMANQMAQALLQSANLQKKRVNNQDKQQYKNNKQQYQSVVDLI